MIDFMFASTVLIFVGFVVGYLGRGNSENDSLAWLGVALIVTGAFVS